MERSLKDSWGDEMDDVDDDGIHEEMNGLQSDVDDVLLVVNGGRDVGDGDDW